jgi:predicted dehydrogenase
MHWDEVSDELLEDVLPPQMDVLGVGLGKGSFIGRSIHKDQWRSIPMLHFRYACPSTNEVKARRFQKTEYMPIVNVSHDFDALLERAINESTPDRLIVWLTVGTGQHYDLIERALKGGAKIIVCDKPIVARFAEYLKIEELLDTYAARIYITFNHRFNAAIEQLKEIAAEALANGKEVEIFTHFWQTWLLADTTSQQAVTRLSDEWCTVLDLSTHIVNLAAHVANAPLRALTAGNLELGLDGEYADVITGATSRLEFEDGLVTARLSSSQTMHGNYMDDIGLRLTFGDDSWYWRLKACGGDSLLVGTRNSDIDKRGDWQQVERGGSAFSDRVTNLFSKHPPGHGSSDWGYMWYYLTRSILGAEWTAQGLSIKDHLEPDMLLRAPTFSEDGLETTLFVHAQVYSGESGGERITIDRYDGELTLMSE